MAIAMMLVMCIASCAYFAHRPYEVDLDDLSSFGLSLKGTNGVEIEERPISNDSEEAYVAFQLDVDVWQTDGPLVAEEIRRWIEPRMDAEGTPVYALLEFGGNTIGIASISEVNEARFELLEELLADPQILSVSMLGYIYRQFPELTNDSMVIRLTVEGASSPDAVASRWESKLARFSPGGRLIILHGASVDSDTEFRLDPPETAVPVG